MLERGPNALKMECSMGLSIHIIWFHGSPQKDANIEEWNEWKAMMEFALDYYPESAIKQVCNGNDDTFLEFMLLDDYQKPSVRLRSLNWRSIQLINV
jgi:hypothetical protein